MAIIKADWGVFFTRAYICLICFSIFGHLISVLLRQDPGFIAPLAGFLTLSTGVLASQWDYWRLGGARAIYSSLAVLGLGALVEIVGLTTGYPFGSYRYTERWWPVVRLGSLGYFPLLLPFAWLMLAGSSAFGARVTRSKICNALIAATIATGLDLLMEGTLAGKLAYWRWSPPGVFAGNSPWTNSVSWFVLSFVAALVFYARGGMASKSGAAIVLVGQGLLMVALR